MNRRKVAVLGAVSGLAIALAGYLVPAYAFPGTPATSLSATPTTIRSGENITFAVNGSTDTSINYTFTGCYMYWVNGAPVPNQIAGPFYPLKGDTLETNYTGVDSTLRFAIYDGVTCDVNNIEGMGTPTSDTGVLTITPQVTIDPVTLTTGKAGPVTVTYSAASSSGTTPFDWSSGYGGDFVEAPMSLCTAPTPQRAPVSALPTGITINADKSPSGSAPSLVLDGTAAAGTEGSYDVCVALRDDTGHSAYSIMKVTVAAPTLPSTGLNTMMLTSAGVGALAAGLLGVYLLIMRRRKARA